MSIIRRFSVPHKRYPHHSCERVLLRCDECGSEFERQARHVKDVQNHFCGLVCNKKAISTGKSAQKKRATFLERYGVEHSVQLTHVRNALQNALAKPEVAAKREATNRERYGVDFPFESAMIREKANETARQRYGSAGWLPQAREAAKAASIERFGVPHFWQSDEFKRLSQDPAYVQRTLATLKRRGHLQSSRSEDAFYEWLVTQFDNVERQVVINKWPIDFYVKIIDAYVQFDGEYWHGLDRTLEEIMRFKTPRDRTILRKYQIDREQNNWFHDNDLRLVRITDKQFQRGQLMALAI